MPRGSLLSFRALYNWLIQMGYPRHPLRLGVLASGRGSNLGAVLDAIDRGALEAEVVVVLSDRPAAPALERARARGIEAAVVAPEEHPDRSSFDHRVVEHLQAAEVQLVVLAGFMRIITTTLLSAFPGRVVNIHPALLPAFPGLHAQRQAVEYGVKVSGCTVHFVDEGVDTGPIILQRSVEVLDDDDDETLAARILVEEHKAYPEAIRRIACGEIRLEGRRVVREPVGAGERS